MVGQPILLIGDKFKAQISRALPSNLAITFNHIGRDIPTFADAAGVTDLIVKAGIYGRLSHTRVVPNAAVVYSNTFFVHILNAWLDGLSMLILEISRLS
jgi:hypothetical protein